MLHNPSRSRQAVAAGVLLAALVIVAALAVGVRLQPSVAIAAEPDAAVWYRCAPANTAAYTNRIHVKCTVANAGIQYFAYPTRDTANASRFLSLLSTATVAGKQLDILYDTADTSGTAFGCAASDCRTIIGIALNP
jgi:hypothetical protein